MNRIRLFFLTGWGIAAEYLLLALCGAGFTLAFPGIDWNMLVWIGVIPPCLAVLFSNPGAAFLKVFVWSWFWNFTAFFWLREIEVPLPVGMAFTLALFTAVWALFAAWFRKNLEFSPEDRLLGASRCAEIKPFAKTLPGLVFLFGSAGLWCLLEWIRSWIFTGLPWNLLAAAQWKNLPLIQICEFTGIYGVSFCIILMNMALAMTIPRLSGMVPGKRFRPLAAALLTVAFALFAGFSLLRKAQKIPTVPFRAGLVQPGLPQLRNPKPGQGEEALEICADLSEELLKKETSSVAVSIDKPAGKHVPLSVVIWPETAVPAAYRGASRLSNEYRHEVGKLLRKYGIPFVLGSLDFELNKHSGSGYDLTNSALLVRVPGGPVADKYSKVHLVPFGEYVPFGDKYPFLNRLVGMGRNLREGVRLNPLELAPGVRAGVSICFESVFPFVSRGHAVNGADLLLVLADDAWYPTSNEPAQHFANALFRTVENRLPLLRSGNASHSLWIDHCGIVREKLMPGLHDRGKGAGVFTVLIPENHTLTFYSRFGNVFIALCGFLTFLAAACAFLNWRSYRLSQKGQQ